jgi:hypothetical protein
LETSTTVINSKKVPTVIYSFITSDDGDTTTGMKINPVESDLVRVKIYSYLIVDRFDCVVYLWIPGDSIRTGIQNQW